MLVYPPAKLPTYLLSYQPTYLMTYQTTLLNYLTTMVRNHQSAPDIILSHGVNSIIQNYVELAIF